MAAPRSVGMSELDLETCLGLPDQKVTSGKTTLFSYYANSTANLNLTIPRWRKGM